MSFLKEMQTVYPEQEGLTVCTYFATTFDFSIKMKVLFRQKSSEYYWTTSVEPVSSCCTAHMFTSVRDEAKSFCAYCGVAKLKAQENVSLYLEQPPLLSPETVARWFPAQENPLVVTLDSVQLHEAIETALWVTVMPKLITLLERMRVDPEQVEALRSEIAAGRSRVDSFMQ